MPKTTERVSAVRNVVPDRVDLRDRVYMPRVAILPAGALYPKVDIPVLNQKRSSACTGFALASVVYHLLRSGNFGPEQYRVSPFMLYSMARRYDEFPGDPNADTGSSLRGALKGWHKHGVCSEVLWPDETMPRPKGDDAEADWWLDAVRRPLGAYYRIDTRSVTDMQIALNEVGIIYASAVCHSGWAEGNSVSTPPNGEWWEIPQHESSPSDGGHAFAIVGYTRRGFILQNSWANEWGTAGRALLTYNDWLANAMDCWVVQLGVITELRLKIAESTSLRVDRRGKVELASDATLRRREISPFIIDMQNNGVLSNTGEFRTQASDVDALVDHHLGKARTRWGLPDTATVDVAIYAHGGLTSERAAADTAAKWIPALYDNRIFPIFLMWETDLWSTLKNRMTDVIAGQIRPTGGIVDQARDWWNERLEKLLQVPGTAIWDEMKQNGEAISASPASGGIKLYEACRKSPWFKDLAKVRIHLIGHSAGAIVHSRIVERLTRKGWRFDTVTFLAPAVRVDTFEASVVPAIRSKQIRRYNQFHLSDDSEQKDPTCRPILGYARSLLYLVSQSFEKGVKTPILGMERYFSQCTKWCQLPNVQAWTAPSTVARSSTHGGFDDDDTTIASVIKIIHGKTP